MASCFDTRENICAYIDNVLDADERRSFEEHIRDCRDCRRELEEMKRITRLCNELPQLELPSGFKAELHEKLLAVASSRNKLIKFGRRSKTLFSIRTYASIAAGILLVFMIGGILRLSLRSPKMTAKSSEQYGVTMDAAPAESTMSAAVEEHQYDIQADGKAYSAKSIKNYAVNGAESPNNGRSAAISDRERTQAIAPGMTEEEIAVNRTSTITILVEDPRASADTVRRLAFENSGEEAFAGDKEAGVAGFRFSESAVAGFSLETEMGIGDDAAAQMKFVFPSMNYDAFVEAVSGLFGEANVRISALVTEDLTDTLNELINESARIDNSIWELQKGNSAGSSEIDELRKEKEIVDGQIESIRLGSDYVTVTVNINNK
ncbi:MAG: zf-HC2 domain-containing protein [Acetivibrionales bacterium]